MSNDISKVYQFLSTIGDWKTNADKDGDGIIVKKEMRSFLQENYFENYSGWDGTAPTENQKNDIINQFWKSIDTNQVGKVGRYKNKNALDTTEQETTNTKVQCYEKLNDFVKENVKINDAPSGISSSQWKASITEGLTEALENFLKNKTAEQISKALESGELDAILQKQLPLSKGRATADYYALNLAGQYKSELGNFDIYSDPVFKELLDKYIDSKFPDGADPDSLPTTDEIKADIEKFVKAYLATANIGDGNIKDLEEEPFGYRQGNEDYLTALQKNQAKIKLNEQISSSYEAMFEEVFAGINLSASDKANLKSQLASTIETAKDTFINSLKYSDWANLDTKLQEFKLSDYVNTDMKNSVLTSYYTEQAKAYISTYDVAAAMGKTLSTDVIASIKTALNGQVSGWVSTFVAAGSASGEFETYLNGKITEYLSSDAVSALIKAEEDKKIAEQAETLKAAASSLTDVSENVKSNNLSEIIGGNATLHTEFGMDNNGNIVFEQQKTTNAYNTLYNRIKTEINKTEAGKAALETLGGENVLKKLVQAAWIDTYNDYRSSESNNAAAFVSKVLDNFQKIMKKLSTNPEYLTVYTSRTSYADTSLTNNLIHYNTDTTGGGDERIVYDGEIKTESDGTIHLSRSGEDADYQTTMNELLKRLKNKYSSISADVVTTVFRNAQKQALTTAQQNLDDCPYGTGANKHRVEDGDNKNWGGRNDRKYDGSKIDMDELVQLTLYFFDKLLYKEIGA